MSSLFHQRLTSVTTGSAGGPGQSVSPDTGQSAHLQNAPARALECQDPPVVSVIVPTFNRPDALALAITSILNQTYQNFEVIIVNDGGCDVRLNVSPEAEHRVRYISHETNRGLAATRNTALRAARGTYVAYLDDDDIFYPDHLEVLVHALRTSGCEVAYTDAVRVYQAPGTGGSATRRETIQSQEFDRDWLLVTNVAPVICFMHTRSAGERVGFFDEELGPLEDWDLWIRMSRECDFLHVKKATCEIRWSLDGSTMTSSQMADFVHQRRRIFDKHKDLTPNDPRARAAQMRSGLMMGRELPRKHHLQQLIKRTKASRVSEEPVVRELLAQLYELDSQLDKSDIELCELEGQLNELARLRDRVRSIPGFKTYHWLRHRSSV